MGVIGGREGMGGRKGVYSFRMRWYSIEGRLWEMASRSWGSVRPFQEGGWEDGC